MSSSQPSQFPISLNEQEMKALAAAEKLFFSDTDLTYAYNLFLQLVSQHPDLGDEKERDKLRDYFHIMFSKENKKPFPESKKKIMQGFAADLLNESDHVQTKEKEKLLRIVYNRLNYSDADRLEALHSLQTYSPYTVFRLGEMSESFKAFCQSSDTLAEMWGEILKESGHLGEALISIDNKIQLPIYNQYIGTFLLDELDYSKKFDIVKDSKRVIAYDEKILTLACDLGLYEALVFRCQMNIDRLQNRFSDKVKLNYEIEHDTKMFKVYWALGYFRAAQMLAIQAESLLANNDMLEAERIYRDALDFFARAYLLETNSTSLKIARIYHADPHLPNEDETISSFIKDSPLDMVTYKEIRRNARRRLQL